jgi:hypothetical protein
MAGAFKTEDGQHAVSVRLYGFGDSRTVADILKALQRTSTDAVDNQRINLVAGQQIDGSQTAAINVRPVIDNENVAHAVSTDVDHREALAATEVA